MSKTKVLFVCLGNICRSPSAEAVFKKIVADRQLAGEFEIDSAGTAAYHAGEGADPRMKQHARKRGYELTSISRPFDPNRDFDRFDIILAMDRENLRNLRRMARDEEDLKKLHLMMDFSDSPYDEVPDPYYGGASGFELVLDLLEQSGNGLLDYLKKK